MSDGGLCWKCEEPATSIDVFCEKHGGKTPISPPSPAPDRSGCKSFCGWKYADLHGGIPQEREWERTPAYGLDGVRAHCSRACAIARVPPIPAAPVHVAREAGQRYKLGNEFVTLTGVVPPCKAFAGEWYGTWDNGSLGIFGESAFESMALLSAPKAEAQKCVKCGVPSSVLWQAPYCSNACRREHVNASSPAPKVEAACNYDHELDVAADQVPSKPILPCSCAHKRAAHYANDGRCGHCDCQRYKPATAEKGPVCFGCRKSPCTDLYLLCRAGHGPWRETGGSVTLTESKLPERLARPRLAHSHGVEDPALEDC